MCWGVSNTLLVSHNSLHRQRFLKATHFSEERSEETEVVYLEGDKLKLIIVEACVL